MAIEEKVINYIASTQPLIEKTAQEKKQFMDSLKKKLANLKKNNCISEHEYNKIVKEAELNPANIFKYMDIPSYSHKIGTSTEKIAKKSDPLMEFAFS